jgi:hypothetical protein
MGGGGGGLWEGGADAAGLPYLAYSRQGAGWKGGGGGRTRPGTRCSLLTSSLTLRLSFSYLHSAVGASFDTKKAYGKPYSE